MLSTNRRHLVAMHIAGEIAPPSIPSALYDVGADGRARVLPSVGGICLNVRVGDNAFAPLGDHIEPAVSVRHKDDRVNVGFCVLACVGNAATVLSGEAKGSAGVVTGKHGGIEHVMIDFDEAVMAKMTLGDKIGIRAVGVGLELGDAGDVSLFNGDPDFFERLGIELRAGQLHVPVAKIVPATVMGSGLGRSTVARGDYDIQTFDAPTVAEYGLAGLRFGDIVAIADADHSYGRIYRRGAMSIGIVAHGRSFIAGHGPGVTSLMTSPSGAIVPHLDPRCQHRHDHGLARRRDVRPASIGTQCSADDGRATFFQTVARPILEGTSSTCLQKAGMMEVFTLSEPLYDVCESWAEEPSCEAWDAQYAEIRAWLIRPN